MAKLPAISSSTNGVAPRYQAYSNHSWAISFVSSPVLPARQGARFRDLPYEEFGPCVHKTFPARLRLRVFADADPAAIAAVVNRFQNVNVLSRRLTPAFGSNETLQIEVDVLGLSEDQVMLIVNKICESPSVVNAWLLPGVGKALGRAASSRPVKRKDGHK